MIFGDPGFYGNNDGFSGFSIQVNDLTGTDFATLNLCLNMEIYPCYLAYNLRSTLLGSLGFAKKILSNIDDKLYSLTDHDLMIELIKRTFNFYYQIEKMILENKIDFNKIKRPDDISSFLYDSIEELPEDRRFWWDIDTFEYTKKGVHPFLISNSKGKTKVVMITEKTSDKRDWEVSRFFTDDLILKNNIVFFDQYYWSIQVIEVNTNYLRKVINEASMFLEGLIKQ